MGSIKDAGWWGGERGGRGSRKAETEVGQRVDGSADYDVMANKRRPFATHPAAAPAQLTE